MTDNLPPRRVAAWTPPVDAAAAAGLSLEQAQAYHASMTARIVELQQELDELATAEEAQVLSPRESELRMAARVAVIRGLETSAKVLWQHIHRLREDAMLSRRHADLAAENQRLRAQVSLLGAQAKPGPLSAHEVHQLNAQLAKATRKFENTYAALERDKQKLYAAWRLLRLLAAHAPDAPAALR